MRRESVKLLVGDLRWKETITIYKFVDIYSSFRFCQQFNFFSEVWREKVCVCVCLRERESVFIFVHWCVHVFCVREISLKSMSFA